MKKTSQNQRSTTSVDIPAVISKQFPNTAVNDELKRFILLTESERKSFLYPKKNPTLSDYLFSEEDDMERNLMTKRSLAIPPVIIRACQVLAEAPFEKLTKGEAITIVLRIAKELKKMESQQNNLEEKNDNNKEAFLSTGLYVMGNKQWFLPEWSSLLNQIITCVPNACELRFVDLFMGGGSLSINATHWKHFSEYIANDDDIDKIFYYEHLPKYKELFKSILLCIDYATSEKGEKYASRIKAEIIKSLYKPNTKKGIPIYHELIKLVYIWLRNLVRKKKKINLILPDDKLIEEPTLVEKHVTDWINSVSEWKHKLYKQSQREYEQKVKKGKHPKQIKLYSFRDKLDNITGASEVLEKIKILNKNALHLAKQYAGNQNCILICDVPYIDTWDYSNRNTIFEKIFTYEHHKQLARYLKKHAEADGIFFYFGRPTCPRDQNLASGKNYSKLDCIYQNKMTDLFYGNEFYYKDYIYDKAHGVLERVTTNVPMDGYTRYPK